MSEQFDVTVIGAGPGGYVAAVRAAQVGLKTAIIEKDKNLGGACLLRGCTPTKELLHSAHVFDLASDPEAFGVSVQSPRLHFEKVIVWKNKVVSRLAGGVGFFFARTRTRFPFSALGKAMILGEAAGFVKVVTDAKYDEVLGVHIIGPHVIDLLSEACVSMGLEAAAKELGHIMHPHPTLSEALIEAAEAVHGMATSI